VCLFKAFFSIQSSLQMYELRWAGKDNAIAAAKLLESTYTLQFDAENSSLLYESHHIFIEGDNIEALRILQNTHRNTIKMIYIDPPYNGGDNTIAYHDQFKTADHRDRHSAWLNMMYPRIALAKNLLKEGGAIFISIDGNEVFNLKLICDEIFGEANYAGEFIWINRTTPNDARINFATNHEFILIYAKNIEKCHFKGDLKDFSKYKNPDNDPNGDWIADNPSAASGNEAYRFPIINPFTGVSYLPPKGRFWAFAPARVAQWTESGKLVFPKEKGKNFILKKYRAELKSELKPISSIIEGILTAKGTKEVKALFEEGSPFKYPKPTELIAFLIEQFTEKEDIVMDFFAGSGTTAHAVLATNAAHNTQRQFICVQLDEICQRNSAAFALEYAKISDITVKRIKLVIKKIEKEYGKNMGFKAYKLN
jgi:adenine-specific DNA-methyltransferase